MTADDFIDGCWPRNVPVPDAVRNATRDELRAALALVASGEFFSNARAMDRVWPGLSYEIERMVAEQPPPESPWKESRRFTKRYVLFGADVYYPDACLDDFLGEFDSLDEIDTHLAESRRVSRSPDIAQVLDRENGCVLDEQRPAP